MAPAYLEVRTSAVCIWSSQGGSSICLDPWLGSTPLIWLRICKMVRFMSYKTSERGRDLRSLPWRSWNRHGRIIPLSIQKTVIFFWDNCFVTLATLALNSQRFPSLSLSNARITNLDNHSQVKQIFGWREGQSQLLATEAGGDPSLGFDWTESCQDGWQIR